MKRIIVIIVVILLVAGGGAGGLVMLGLVPNPFNPKLPDAPLTAGEKVAAELSRKNKFKPPSAEFPLVKMEDLVVPVIINGKVQRRVLLIARIMAATKEDEGYVKNNMNRFQSALINDLVPYFQTYFVSHDMVDVVEVKARLVKAAKAVYGEHAQDVLLVNAFEQSNGRVE